MLPLRHANAAETCDGTLANCHGFYYSPDHGKTNYTAAGLKEVSADIEQHGESSQYWKAFHDNLDNTITPMNSDGSVNDSRGMMCYDRTGSGSTDTCNGTLGDYGDAIEFRLVGMLHDDRADGKGKAGLTFMTTDSRAIPTHQMNGYGSTLGGWRDSLLRRNLNSGDIWVRTPTVFRSNVTAVSKTTNQEGYYNKTASAAVDRMWLFDAQELWGYDSGRYAPSFQYEFFQGKVTSSSYTALNSTNVKSSDSSRWLRRPSNGPASNFDLIGLDGSYYWNSGAHVNWGVVPGFTF